MLLFDEKSKGIVNHTLTSGYSSIFVVKLWYVAILKELN